MTAPRFRSTAAFTMRQRQTAPAIDRATFVIFSLGGQRFAAPAESVERVLRHAQSDEGPGVVEHNGRRVPIIDLRATLRAVVRLSIDTAVDEPVESTSAAHLSYGRRTLVLSVLGAWVAATVDAVYEVATIDAALVRPVELGAGSDRATMPVRGQFLRHDQEVLVLDMMRVVRAVYEATAHAAVAAGHPAAASA